MLPADHKSSAGLPEALVLTIDTRVRQERIIGQLLVGLLMSSTAPASGALIFSASVSRADKIWLRAPQDTVEASS